MHQDKMFQWGHYLLAEVIELRTTSRKAWMQARGVHSAAEEGMEEVNDGENRDEIMQEAYDMLSCSPMVRKHTWI